MNRKITILLALLVLGFCTKTSAQGFCPDNVNFEDGTLANWNFYRGQNATLAGVAVWSVSACSPVPSLHTSESGTGVDAYGGFPVVAPGGGSYSLKLGKDSTNNNADGATTYLHIPSLAGTYSLIYMYAMVLENPAGHTAEEQPRMTIVATDSTTNDTLACTSYSYVSASTDPGFVQVGTSDVYYKSWTEGNMKFVGENGKTVTISVFVGGCTLGGHFGYAYFDMSCGTYAVSTLACGSTTETLSAPSGYSGYSWKDSATYTISYGTTQNVSVPVPTLTTTYAVILTPYSGYGCTDTLFVRVEPSDLSIRGTWDTSFCRGGSASLTSSATDIALPLTYAWSPASGLSCTNCSTVVASPTVTTNYVDLVTDASGCFKADTFKFIVYANPVPISGLNRVCTGTTITLTDTSGGGRWSSSAIGTATVGSTGVGTSGLVTSVAVGTTVISYTIGGMCVTTLTVAVNPTPPAITGVLEVCPYTTTTVSDGMAGGTWTSTITGMATVGSSTGLVTGVAAGSTTISYIITSTGCSAATELTVNPLPTGISGNTSFCTGTTTALTDGTFGGTWSTSNASVATVNTTGLVNGVSAGTASITYTLATGCLTEITVTVNPLPTAIFGSAQACVGLTTTLADATSGGSWSSSNVTVATIGTSSGVVTGNFQGTATVTYTLASTGCNAYITVTVNPLPDPISGISTICLGSSTTLSDIDPGGTWSSSSSLVAFINATSGYTLGVSSGVANITFTLPTSCIITVPVTVYPNPSAITGPTIVCVGQTITESDVSGGGTWSSSNTAVATILLSSGLLTGVSAGTSVISYMVSTGCFATTTITVSPSPSVIGGLVGLCDGASVTLSDGVSGGTWTSSNATVATVGSSTGTLTGMTVGTAIITYSLGGTCRVTHTATVITSPGAITGTPSVCIGTTSILSDAGTGTWSSAATGVATVGTTGVVTGVSSGTVIITYKLSDGCYSTTNVTVNPTPAAIGGARAVCLGAATTLTDVTGPGTWSSTGSVVSVGSTSGVVTSAALGTAIVTYSIGACRTTASVTVNPVPAAITGTLGVCVGATTTLNDVTAIGTWSTSNAAVATVGSSSGIVAGISQGTCEITYQLPTGCYATVTATVNVTPLSITGSGSICAGTYTTLGDITALGSWISGNAAVATIGSSSGILFGVSGGTVVITYTLGSSCIATRTETISTAPSAPTGPTAVCIGASVSLGDAIAGGTWTSSATGIATINASSGLLHGTAFGTTIITYTVGGGCFVTDTIAVSPTPTAITGATPVCMGSTTVYTDTVSGGLWISGSTSVATIGSTTGVVNGVALGVSEITYTLGSGCTAYKSLTVIASPDTIAGVASICQGATTALTDLTPGGLWLSSNALVASVTSVGIVTGVGAGTAVISYVIPTGCSALLTVTVSPTPAAIVGSSSLCSGTTISLSDVITGGLWSSTSADVTVGSTSGVVTGVAGGVAVISYTLGGTCSAVKTVSVFAAPIAISGPSALCLGATITLSDSVTSGTWTSSDVSVATIGLSTGVVTGVRLGSTIVTYVAPGGCSITTTINVSATPTPITGLLYVCAGTTSTLGDGVTGGLWTLTGATGVASIGSVSGMVTGIAAGTDMITYSLGSGCIAVATVTVIPSPASIAGTASLCVGATSDFTDITVPGTWASGSALILTINATSGVATGVAAGSSIITYTIGDGCIATRVVTVNPLPASISGTLNICSSQSTALSDATPGGTWTSGTTSVATIGLSTGSAYGAAAGTSTITYVAAGGCSITAVLTVNPTPAAISGTTTICAGTTTLLSDVTSSGTWTSSNAVVASVGSLSGVVAGLSSGSAIITYSLGLGCNATVVVEVKSSPVPMVGSVNMCDSTTAIYTDGVGGGTWHISDPLVATIGVSTGSVSAIHIGTAIITYTLPSECYVTQTLTVNPGASPISVPTHICSGSCYDLTDLVSGGSWTSTNPLVATIDPTTGLLCGVTTGSSIITYFIGAGCQSTTTVTVLLPPSPITGLSSICEGSGTTLIDGTIPGSWVSGAPTIATVVSGSGLVTGVGGGATMITYIIGDGCSTTFAMTVNPIAPVGGPAAICQGQTANMTEPVPGGTWSSSDAGVASVDPVSGVVTGVSAGVATITMELATGCIATKTLTVNPLPDPITGIASVCIGHTTTLSDATGTGTWISGSGSIASVGITGIVTGLTAGESVITYRLATGCLVTDTVSVNHLPGPITETTLLCAGSTITFSDTSTGGTWSVSGAASIGATTGILTGSAGAAVITYTSGSGCNVTKTVTILPTPSAISGTDHLCVGQSTTLSDSYPLGSWTSSNGTIASISSAGLVTGASAGTVTISYSLSTGCYTSVPFSVIPLPSVIGGDTIICAGAVDTLTDLTAGGVWNSSNPLIASIDPVSGVTTAWSSGSVLISYTLGTGCTEVIPLIVNPLSPIDGPSAVCVGQNIFMNDSTTGGHWSSSATGIASAAYAGDTTGIISGVAAGAAIIYYTLPTGCFAAKSVTVNPIPAGIGGLSQVCVSQSITLTDATFRGLWISSDLSIASVGVATGVVTGVDSGVVEISYSVLGCPAVKTVVVNPLPAAILGDPSICLGHTTTLSDATSGGAWSSSDVIVAPVGPFGLVSGESAGTATITYMLPTGCIATEAVVVNPAVGPIVGNPNFCIGSTSAFTDATGGGTWVSTDPGIASVVSGTGVVTGVSLGTATVIYVVGTGCTQMQTVNILSLPPAIVGSPNVCVGATDTLADLSGGSWISGSSSIASVSGTGVVTGVATGGTIITFTLGAGCTTTMPITVNPLPLPVSGTNQVCVGLTTALSDGTGGGSWSSFNTAIATADASTGVVTGVDAGNVQIAYTLGTGCSATMSVSVSPMPAPFSGDLTVCYGSESTLGESVHGGSWYSVNTTVATVGSTGIVSGVSIGTSVISYMLGPGCKTQSVVTVVALPNQYAVTGGGAYCEGGNGRTVGLASSDAGTNYVLYRGSTATGAFPGTGFPVNFGLETIAGTYTVTGVNTTTGCNNAMTGSATISITPTVVPVASVSGASTVCDGTTNTYTVTATGGGSTPSFVWNVNGTSVGTGVSYTYVPANGDHVGVTMTSVANCANPDTVTGVMIMTTLANVHPYVSFTSNPGDTVCRGIAVTVSAVPVNGGPSPTYQWIVDGSVVGAGPVFSFIPDDGDSVSCVMTSDYACLLSNPVISQKVPITVDSPILPSVVINASPGTVVPSGKTVTLTAEVTNGGTSPTYQWYVNSVPVPGATSQVFTKSNFDSTFEDSVSVVVTSSGICPMSAHNWVYIEVSDLGVHTLQNSGALAVMPNPNKGQFTITGTVGNTDEELVIEVTDLLGQVVYQSKSVAPGGKVNEHVTLSNALANGVYILNVHTDTDNLVFHIVVEQ